MSAQKFGSRAGAASLGFEPTRDVETPILADERSTRAVASAELVTSVIRETDV
jgi:hypothetical protein